MKRGEIWLVDLGNGIGSEQGGTRPCAIIQNDTGNKFAPITIVAPITTKNKNFATTHMDIELLNPSTIMLEQVRVIDKSRLVRKVAEMDTSQIQEMNQKLKIALGLEERIC